MLMQLVGLVTSNYKTCHVNKPKNKVTYAGKTQAPDNYFAIVIEMYLYKNIF